MKEKGKKILYQNKLSTQSWFSLTASWHCEVQFSKCNSQTADAARLLIVFIVLSLIRKIVILSTVLKVSHTNMCYAQCKFWVFLILLITSNSGNDVNILTLEIFLSAYMCLSYLL